MWAGLECTINRTKDKFRDQLLYTGHYTRKEDISTFAKLNIHALRYPVLWEHHEKRKGEKIDWTWARTQLACIAEHNITPIVGLLHHGSGPAFTNLLDLKFSDHLADYARAVASEFPWVEYYTPVNEPLTTARFSGLYGLWFPHHRKDHSFLKMLLNEVKGTIVAMKAIRSVNPNAKLIQTEDLAKIHSTKLLNYQAKFENERRWLSFDLLFGFVDQQHYLWKYLLGSGIEESELAFFIENSCTPDILGLNYYVTSERYLDDNKKLYPRCTHGGNGQHHYADVEAVRVKDCAGIGNLLREVWARYKAPMAITEAHLSCTREEQMRWFKEIWDTSCDAVRNGIDVRAVTAWSLLGAYDWSSLLTAKRNHYEVGVYDVRNGALRPTAMTKLIKSLATTGNYHHPVLENCGWWKRDVRFIKKNDEVSLQSSSTRKCQPLLIIGKNGTLGRVLARTCEKRNISYILLSRKDLDISRHEEILSAIDNHKPWAIINAAGYVRVDEAETQRDECFRINALGPKTLAETCRQQGVRFMTFSSDLVFDGVKPLPYLEDDLVGPLNVYGQSKAAAEKFVMKEYDSSLIIRTSAFFGPWDQYNFAHHVLSTLQSEENCHVVNDVVISPTYVPDLADAALDLFIDEVDGIWHLCNDTFLTWSDFAGELAERAGFKKDSIVGKSLTEMNWLANRPKNSAMQSTRGMKLPTLKHALDRYFKEKNY